MMGNAGVQPDGDHSSDRNSDTKPEFERIAVLEVRAVFGEQSVRAATIPTWLVSG
jgi:hypothetical protein